MTKENREQIEDNKPNNEVANEMQDLFQSFVEVMSSAIDERTPYNLTHTRNMVENGTRFVDFINSRCRKAGKEEAFSDSRKEEFLISIWLHDIGKLVIPLGVMNKGTRFRPHQLSEILHRMEKVELWTEIKALKGEITEEEKERAIADIRMLSRLVMEVNHAEFTLDGREDELLAAKEMTYLDLDGTRVKWFSSEEYELLTIKKGTFSAKERQIMQAHVDFTDKLLSKIKFPQNLSNVRAWASAHHELLDGSGYPNRLSGDQIPYEVRMITILDIFDALVADDRPYKPGISVEAALDILTEMAEEEGKLDARLTKLFIESECWKEVDACE